MCRYVVDLEMNVRAGSHHGRLSDVGNSAFYAPNTKRYVVC